MTHRHGSPTYVRAQVSRKGPSARRRLPGPLPGRPIRIVVADDHPIDLKGLQALLCTQADFEVVGEAASGVMAVACCQQLKPDVLILDTRMPNPDNVFVIARVHGESPNTKILVLAGRSETRCMVLNLQRPGVVSEGDDERDEMSPCGTGPDCLELAIHAGAHGAVRRSNELEDLFRAIRALASGHVYYEPGVASRMVARAANPATSGARAALTERQRDIAELVARGRSNKEIGSALGISELTVKKHLVRVYAKLGVFDRLQAGLLLARNPLLLRCPGDVSPVGVRTSPRRSPATTPIGV